MLKASTSPRAKTWISKGFKGHASYVQALGEGIAATVEGESDVAVNNFTDRQISKW